MDGHSRAHAAIVDAALPDPRPMLPPETPHVLVAAASTPDPLQDHTKEALSSVETLDECFVLEICVDQYLWSVLMEYVIGGMDRSFKLKLYHALRALDDAGLSPGITSGFRDDYRQSLASGTKAATESSYHGGSRRGGYGHGLAADLVSVKGETRSERWSSSKNLWKWIDAHGKEIGIGRPYLDKDPPHVAPIDGKEYADHRGGANAQLARD